jgi:hypothetical protein
MWLSGFSLEKSHPTRCQIHHVDWRTAQAICISSTPGAIARHANLKLDSIRASDTSLSSNTEH